MLNYVVEPAMLHKRIPSGTELDIWNGRAYVSVVGFLFLRTRVRGLAIPFHTDFEEVNLRFYVRRKAPDGWRRGVVFIRELVPRRMVAWTAQLLYNEPYSHVPMAHRLERDSEGSLTRVAYSWTYHGQPAKLAVTLDRPPGEMVDGSEEQFITEHYWGYCAQRNGTTMEYRVVHPSWSVCAASDSTLECDVADHYGQDFVEPLSAKPTSAFLADGSAIEIFKGTPL
jgi:uncharacterized protein YqjF (DUF2071 family)